MEKESNGDNFEFQKLEMKVVREDSEEGDKYNSSDSDSQNRRKIQIKKKDDSSDNSSQLSEFEDEK